MPQNQPYLLRAGESLAVKLYLATSFAVLLLYPG